MGVFIYSMLRLFSLFLLPLAMALAMLVAAGAASRLRRRRLAVILAVTGVGWLWFWSIPVVADSLSHRLEAQHRFRPAAAYPTADLIVVLGGGVEAPALRGRTVPDLGGAADREWFAAQLFHAGKARRILVSGGRAPGRQTHPGAVGMVTFLRALGVPANALVAESSARNTLENARLVDAQLAAAGAPHVLLVTSAAHMPRALRLFRGSKARITPAPTDHQIIDVDFSAQRLIPSAHALSRSTDTIEEYLGLWAAGLQRRLQP